MHLLRLMHDKNEVKRRARLAKICVSTDVAPKYQL